MNVTIRYSVLSVLVLVLSNLAAAQTTKNLIPDSYRGNNTWIARGIMDGNLIETNFRNHGELSRWSDIPWGVWPRGVGGRHVDGIAIVVAGQVVGQRLKYPQFFPGAFRDTTLNPVIINYRDAGRLVGTDGYVWGWTPLNDFHNPNRFDPVTGNRTPNPALSDDPTSWPSLWPDRLDEEASGWPNSWNGMFGRGVKNADLESFYVMDDYRDRAYHIDTSKTPRVAYSKFGVYYADPADSSKGGLGLQVKTRLLQWSNVLAEDAMFLLYTITNRGGTSHDRLYFTQLIDYGLGNEEGDENAAFDPIQDVVYGWDQDGIGQRQTGGTYKLGYVGMAFLESPANATNGQDDDEDGIRDEDRFSGPGTLVTGASEISSRTATLFNLENFVAKYGRIEDRPAYQAGRWWTADENMDWVGYSDLNQNNVWDSGEPINNDTGVDGLGPFDLGYPGPDLGEADGIPQNGEPNYNLLDVDESDQIGLRGFELGTRPFYENGENLRLNGDTWIWDRIRLSIFELGVKPARYVADVEPFALFVSGPVRLNPGATDFFSTAWIFGADETDFFKNRKTVQNIYNSDYNFAQPPITPRLTAVAGDGEVILSWDTLSIRSFDRFLQEFDFEGYRLYKGTDPLFSDAKLITNVDGTPIFFKPIAQFDLVNGIKGSRTVMGGEATYNMGSDNGLAFFYVDKNVTNGKTYYYAISAYDRGLVPDSGDPIDPQETTFRISVDQAGKVIATTPNAAVVIPRPKAAGFVAGGTTQQLDKVTSGRGTGSVKVNLLVTELADYTAQYRLTFFDTLVTYNDTYLTSALRLDNRKTNETVIGTRPLTPITPMQQGFVIEINNATLAINAEKTGWIIRKGTSSQLIDNDPTKLDGMTTNWVGSATEATNAAFVRTADDFTLVWVNPTDSTYTPPRYFGLGDDNLRAPFPLFAINTTKNEKVDYFVIDIDKSKTLTSGDTLIINEFDLVKRVRKFRFNVTFRAKVPTASVDPTAGNRFEINQKKPFKSGDYFDFTLAPPSIDTVAARLALKDIKVVPNPYLGASVYEQRSQIVGRGERRIQFTNLPANCSIRIFNLRGELLQTLIHQGGTENGSRFWDLKTRENQDLAYGVYIFHVEAPGIGQHIGKFAVIK